MDLPVKFPSETEVILEDVARFRALSPGDRIRSLPSSRRGRTDGDLALAGELPVVWSEFIAELVMQCESRLPMRDDR